MSLVTSVVIVGHTPAGANLGTFPTLNFAPLSPWSRLRSFSSSLRSIRTMRMLILFNIDYQNPHIFSPPPTQVWMQFTYSLIGRSTMIPFLSRERERPNALGFIQLKNQWFTHPPPAYIYGRGESEPGVHHPSERTAGKAEKVSHSLNPHRPSASSAILSMSAWSGCRKRPGGKTTSVRSPPG